jgi:hypothetical protein
MGCKVDGNRLPVMCIVKLLAHFAPASLSWCSALPPVPLLETPLLPRHTFQQFRMGECEYTAHPCRGIHVLCTLFHVVAIFLCVLSCLCCIFTERALLQRSLLRLFCHSITCCLVCGGMCSVVFPALS